MVGHTRRNKASKLEQKVVIEHKKVSKPVKKKASKKKSSKKSLFSRD